MLYFHFQKKLENGCITPADIYAAVRIWGSIAEYVSYIAGYVIAIGVNIFYNFYNNVYERRKLL